MLDIINMSSTPIYSYLLGNKTDVMYIPGIINNYFLWNELELWTTYSYVDRVFWRFTYLKHTPPHSKNSPDPSQTTVVYLNFADLKVEEQYV